MDNTIKKTLGGDRLGSGSKLQVEMHNFGRSTHDLGYIWRSSMAAGTLVPYLSTIGLPGDTFDIDLNADVKTLPTVGPMFGSFKLQLDVFQCPIRLYQGLLHNNKLGIGMQMDRVKLPLLNIEGKNLYGYSLTPWEFQQINQSSLLAYLGIRGIGRGAGDNVSRKFNAIPYLAYFDIYKNYYANKQEEIGAIINSVGVETVLGFTSITGYNSLNEVKWSHTYQAFMNDLGSGVNLKLSGVDGWEIRAPKGMFGDKGKNLLWQQNYGDSPGDIFTTPEYFNSVSIDTSNKDYDIMWLMDLKYPSGEDIWVEEGYPRFWDTKRLDQKIGIKTFELSQIDLMRENILSQTKNTEPYIIDKNGIEPYSLGLKPMTNGNPTAQMSMEGLLLKTYQSDLYNNWLSTEWIDGETGINSITAISTEGDSFTLDTLNLSKKVYDMLNRIAVSGGSYDDWVQAVYGIEPFNRSESPVYLGGLSKEVVFSEVISTAEAGSENPLGTLAGKGVLANKHKGGKIHIKVNEPSYIIGIVSLTPRIDYSQGNNWDVNLKTLDDLHKPSLDEIGFQELITDGMAFWDTLIQNDGRIVFKSAGKQPAWINYMTNVNKCYGNFADPRKEMYMTLNRRYEVDDKTGSIKDLTTYIDPSKYNYMFAQTSIDSQNFWCQIAVDITARRKMSSKVMPNL